ncbi:uncharacterized protein BX663DRAFT_483161 [Cokeromyces recurvatus]|uniref:uncharacterized protein n=1 Tax=Cokeromyces recurvatus TaxID=90255 RepID=UPI00221F304A|nr:uncharacterized protein BX663DRAFT_483161 [Cokeromyces recurvatus]KAI7906415.1 hypothetical protein BX663DRAFT_483161 [Cokeromyces recurvatus]
MYKFKFSPRIGSGNTVCCCISIRMGVLIISSLILSIYLANTILIFIYAKDLEKWSTMEQNVDTPLTLEAFNTVFYSFASVFIIYIIISFLGIISIIIQHRRMVRIYHVMNWFLVLLLFTVTVACWVYFKVKQDTYVNDCQDIQNIKNNITADEFYTQIRIPGKQPIAPGSDKSECVELVKRIIIISGICVFMFNFIQIYWARSIGKYATSLKKNCHHKILCYKVCRWNSFTQCHNKSFCTRTVFLLLFNHCISRRKPKWY